MFEMQPPEMQIPFHKTEITEEDLQAVSATMRSGWLTMGPKVREFEERFAEYCGVPYAVAVNSCTAGLHLALEAIGLQPGDEVIVPVMTFTATAEVICYFGAKPVFVDIDPDTHLIDVNKIEAEIRTRTRAIIPVHYAGQPADLDEIHAIADQHRLHVIEDAAHAPPSIYQGRHIGGLSDMTAFSFYATKTLPTGEGGMVTTHSEQWANRMRVMRLHGMSKDAWKRNTAQGSWYYDVVETGFKYNMTDPTAALGLSQMDRMYTNHAKRAAIAARYTEALDPDTIEPLHMKEDRSSSWHLYVVRLGEKALLDRNASIQALSEKGITCSVHFIPLHLQPAYQKKFGYNEGDFPVAEDCYKRMFSLPIWPEMQDTEVEHVISAVNSLAG